MIWAVSDLQACLCGLASVVPEKYYANKKEKQLKTTQSYPAAMSMNHSKGQQGKKSIKVHEKALKCWWQIAANWA